MVTGQKDAIRQLYLAIPIVLGDILNNDSSKIIKDPLFDELFIKAFNWFYMELFENKEQVIFFTHKNKYKILQ